MDLKNDSKAVEVDELGTGKMEIAEGGEKAVVLPELTMLPSMTLTPLTSLRSTSSSPYVFNSTHNFHRGSSPSNPLPRPIPYPHPFANTIPQPLTCLFSKAQRAHHFVSPVSTHPFLAVQKRSSKNQTRSFTSSPADHSNVITANRLGLKSCGDLHRTAN